jgi:outer membrane biosynthesis protein TonB
VAAQETAPGAPSPDRPPILQPPAVRYHPQGLEQQEGGFVLLQFVVDPAGRVDTSTIQVVRASDGRYIEAALLTAAGSSYSPGLERGRPIRVMIQQLFRFEAGGTRCEQVIVPVRHPQCVDSVLTSP